MTAENLAIRSFGTQASEEILLTFVENYNFPVVSVGSGSASLEYKIQQKNKGIRWICVDPTPSSWCIGEVMIQPEYTSVEELIKAEPEIVGKCVLFLNWCFPNDSRYDYDAVILLEPVAFLSTVEFFELVAEESPNGSAGGKMFHDLVANSGSNGYTFCFNATLYYENDVGHPLDVRFIWYQKTKLPEPEIVLAWDYPCKIRHPQDACSIS